VSGLDPSISWGFVQSLPAAEALSAQFAQMKLLTEHITRRPSGIPERRARQLAALARSQFLRMSARSEKFATHLFQT